MCTKEIAALTTVMFLALATVFSMISLAGFSTWFQPRDVPAASVLAHFDWQSENSVHSVTPEQMDEYEETGYQVFRQVIDPKAIELLLAEAKRLCKSQLWVSTVCQIEEGRWQSDLIRDFLFYSNVSTLASKLLRDERDPPLRVYQDGIVGITSSWLQPLFYTFTRHVDHGGVPGIWHGLHSDTHGVSLWIPLVEIDPNVTGGSITLFPKFPQNGCQVLFGERSTVDGFDATINMSFVAEQCMRSQEGNSSHTPHVRPGDVVAWWPQMMQQTQRVLQKGFVRYALYVRLVTNETMVCMQKDCGWKGRPCCSGALPKSGTLMKTPCYPQVYPRPLDQEVRAHYSKKPQPLLDRNKMMSKYSTDVVGGMHPVCKKHRQGGPSKFWQELKNRAPLPERSRPPIMSTTEFDCAHAKHEGTCWILDDSLFSVERLPWSFQNYSSKGVPMFFSKDHEDTELMYRVPFQTTIRGVKEDSWIRVGDYYVIMNFFGAVFSPADFLDQSGKLEGGAPSARAAEGNASARAAEAAAGREAEASAEQAGREAEEPSAPAAPTHAEL